MKLWRVDDVMSRDVAVVHEHTPCWKIVETIIDRRIGAVPVVDETGRAIGVVSASDLLPGPVNARSGHFRRVRPKGRSELAREVMTSPAVTVLPSLAVDFAARLMRRAMVHRLVVVDRNGRVIGIVTRRDLLRTRLGEGPAGAGLSALPARRTADLT